MTERRKMRSGAIKTEFDEAVARLLQADPKELAKSVAGDVLKQRERAQKQIEKARKEIEDGARPKKGRFRL